ncbi:MAG: hypothetical protein IPL46_00980 [Saprospiraceae bacterium]|nr:hypothetical protein [Saprospiraceae bacterium]
MKRQFCLLCLLGMVSLVFAQIQENTYEWGAFDHSAWKIQPNSNGYAIMGNKFFEPNNTSLYAQGLNKKGEGQWFMQYPAVGFSSLQTFWKSFIATPSHHSGSDDYFAVTTGIQNGSSKTYALLINSSGKKIWDKVSDVPSGIQIGGANNADYKGGWIATGSNSLGELVVLFFDGYGILKSVKNLGISGFGWTVIPLKTGGYVIGSTGARVTRIDSKGDLVWTTMVPLPVSPDGSSYSYTEFEEIIELPYGKGVIMTGSAFSNQHSAVYTLKVDYAGNALWKTIHDPQNTGLPVLQFRGSIALSADTIL